MAVEVRQIQAAETLPVRWPVLRPGFPQETAIFAGDEAPGTLHFGAFVDGLLAGVASIYRADVPDAPLPGGAMQLRGMATLPEFRGTGVGRALVEVCVKAATQAGAAWLWCNARESATPFYAKHGWEVFSEQFDIPTVGPHFRMRLKLAHNERSAV